VEECHHPSANLELLPLAFRGLKDFVEKKSAVFLSHIQLDFGNMFFNPRDSDFEDKA